MDTILVLGFAGAYALLLVWGMALTVRRRSLIVSDLALVRTGSQDGRSRSGGQRPRGAKLRGQPVSRSAGQPVSRSANRSPNRAASSAGIE